MEPNGIVNCVIQIWNSGKAWLKALVSNDDSSSHVALQHSIEVRMLLDDLEVKLKNTTGKLPAHIK